ncbi:hypothetical protein [Phenylobacterium sp.]|uniref:hypothetical protein n=1 Tax=Phenylobacterium sp. TaxID=1871053 RepID=UPI0035AEC30A
MILSKIARGAGVAAEWIIRLTTTFIGVAVLIGCAVSGMIEPWAFVGVPISAYIVLGMLVPNHMSKALKRTGALLSEPYNRFFLPYVVEPIESVAERVVPLAGKALLGVAGFAIALVGIVLLGFLGAAASKSLAALPVSVAVVVGAVIIASALASKRS